MRKSPATQKTTGSVLVPLFLEQAEGETIETAVARAQFDEVWVVFQALQEHDEELAEIIRHMREERGRTKGYDNKAFRGRVEVLGPGVSLDALPHSITTQIVDQIGSSWDERYGELAAFKAEYGDCNVPRYWAENRSLAYWVNNQRGGRQGAWVRTASRAWRHWGLNGLDRRRKMEALMAKSIRRERSGSEQNGCHS